VPTIGHVGDKEGQQISERDSDADQETDDEQDKTIFQLEGRIGVI
jgi:hypothetical protein